MSILVSGSLVYDHIMNFPDSFKNHILPEQIHILNVAFMVDKLEKSWGGTAGNIAYTIKLLGGDPHIISAVGKDGGDYLKHFKKHGINISYIKQDKKQLTASAYITTDADDNQITAFFGGPLGLANHVKIKNIAERPQIAIISPTQKEIMIEHLREAKGAGLATVFDPGQQISAFSGEELRRLLPLSDFVVGNDYEIKLLQDRAELGAKDILKEAKVLITTFGEKGSTVSTSDGKIIKMKSCPPKSADDPTGAGDAFRAGFFFGYEKGFDLKTCAQIGSVAASYAIETYGTQAHNFTTEEFENRYYKNYEEKISL